MGNWTATNELRFVERNREASVVGRPIPMVRILQQKWKHNEASYYGGRIVSEEWRDVPVVEEL
jgi:hypothetical protein